MLPGLPTSVLSRKFVPYACTHILLGRSLKIRHFGDLACRDTYSANLRDGILDGDLSTVTAATVLGV